MAATQISAGTKMGKQRMALSRCQRHTVLSRSFRFIESLVCVADYGRGVAGVQAAIPDTDTHCYRTPFLFFLDRNAQPLRDEQGTVSRCAGEQDRKLFSTIAADEVAPTTLLFKNSGDGAENLVSHLVPIGIIHPLEVVYIEQQNREVASIPFAFGYLGHQSLIKGPPVPTGG